MTKRTGIISYSRGSGKTTTCAYLAAALTIAQRKVVCVDLDGQLRDFTGAGGETIRLNELSWKYRKWRGEDDALADDADYILVDVPARPTPEEEKIFSKLDSVLIPVEAEYYGQENLKETLQKVGEYEHLMIRGLLLTKSNPNSTQTEKIERELRKYFSFLVLNTPIERSFYLSRFGLTNLNGQGWHSGLINYLELANELLEHEC